MCLSLKGYIALLAFLFVNTPTHSQQQLQEVLSENFTVNSTTSLNGNTRNFAEVVLPEKALGYVYRLTVTKKGTNAVSNSLFTLLKQAGGTFAMGVSLTQFAIQNNDGEAVDAFIFSNTYDKDNFYTKKDGNWQACKQMPNRTNCCFSTADCVGRRIYFGFRNNNIRQGLDVKLEVVAIIDPSNQQATGQTYSINNSTPQEREYQISSDGLQWEKILLRPGYTNNHTSPLPELYIRIFTTPISFVSYKIKPLDRYKIMWNQTKWDLSRY